MALKEFSELRQVSGISEAEQQRIKDFLQGAIYCWCKNRKDKWFSLRDLMGGDNYYWRGTPLLKLYLKHEERRAQDPVKEAGKDAGWLSKSVVDGDKRLFDSKEEARIRQYRWIVKEEDTEYST